MKVDFGNVLTVLSLVGGTVLFVLAAWLAYRKGYDLVLKRAAEEWEKLAQAQEKRMALMEANHQQTLAENEELRKRNDTLIRLNLALQTNNAEQAAHISRLEQRVRELELRTV